MSESPEPASGWARAASTQRVRVLGDGQSQRKLAEEERQPRGYLVTVVRHTPLKGGKTGYTRCATSEGACIGRVQWGDPGPLLCSIARVWWGGG